jgi:hypothetical protein
MASTQIDVCTPPPIDVHCVRFQEKKMKFQKLTPNLVVHDVAAAVNFYCSVLGFQPGLKCRTTRPMSSPP